MKHCLPVIEPHIFRERDFVAGDVLLDFVNTMTGRNGTPRDWLGDFDSLVDWAAARALLTKQRCAALKTMSQQRPAEATAALDSARALRELLYRVLTQAIDGGRPSAQDLERLRESWLNAVRGHGLQFSQGAIRPALIERAARFDDIANTLTIRAVQLLGELQAHALRQCAGTNCAWLFIDSSKAGRRRWCDMATCGNVAKAQRHSLSKKTEAKRRRA